LKKKNTQKPQALRSSPHFHSARLWARTGAALHPARARRSTATFITVSHTCLRANLLLTFRQLPNLPLAPAAQPVFFVR